MSDYLWDRSGPPDAEVAHLETLLAGHAHRGTMPALRTRASFPLLATLAAAASIALAAGAAHVARSAPHAGWGVETMSGAPRVSGEPVVSTTRLHVGDVLVTDAGARARLGAGDVGEVEVAPNSQLRLLRARSGEHRMVLQRGEIHASIWAPPRQFYVNTPSSTTVDLGCAYTLRVDRDGSGHVAVEHGWVAFEFAGRESFIPQNAVCDTRPGIGPGTPHYADAAPALAAGLSILDFEPTGNVSRADAFNAVLAAARPKDALTLWHLLSRTTPPERARVYDRLAAFVPPPPGVTRDAVLRGDRQALDAWWNALGLDSTSWWHLLTRPWRQP